MRKEALPVRFENNSANSSLLTLGRSFLDEIGDMSARTQAKVLRVLQSGEVEPVGAQQVVTVDVRVIAATNRNLENGDERRADFVKISTIA